MLQAAIAKLPEEEAKYHMKRCVDSGLWVPEGGLKKDGENDEEEEDDEDIYHEAFTTPPVSNDGTAAVSTTDDID